MNTEKYFSTEVSSYYDNTKNDYLRFCSRLEQLAGETLSPSKPIIFLCIGSDRITGDCLGPLVGHKIKKIFPHYPYVFGTLKNPVHALNLNYYLKEIYQTVQQPFCIAVDAALGNHQHIGYITLSNHALTPGEGLRKTLPRVGDISITGVVNTLSGDPARKLQETRLHLVNELADFISTGICDCFSSRLSF